MKHFTTIVALASLNLSAAVSFAGVAVTNLITDDQTVRPATITDTNLKNAWGVSYLPGGPFWVSSNHASLATVYTADPTTNTPSIVPLTVNIPGDGSVTGQVPSNTADFNADLFLF